MPALNTLSCTAVGVQARAMERQAHNRGALGRLVHWTLALLLLATLVTACALPGPTTVTYTAYRLTCCTQTDIDQVWRPGTTVELHWIVETSKATTVNPTHKLVTSATLLGPYSDVTTLKQAIGGTHAVQGSIITTDDRTPPDAGTVSTFLLPPDLPSGYYKLNIKSDFGDGGSAGGSSIVRVGSQ